VLSESHYNTEHRINFTNADNDDNKNNNIVIIIKKRMNAVRLHDSLPAADCTWQVSYLLSRFS